MIESQVIWVPESTEKRIAIPDSPEIRQFWTVTEKFPEFSSDFTKLRPQITSWLLTSNQLPKQAISGFIRPKITKEPVSPQKPQFQILTNRRHWLVTVISFQPLIRLTSSTSFWKACKKFYNFRVERPVNWTMERHEKLSTSLLSRFRQIETEIRPSLILISA